MRALLKAAFAAILASASMLASGAGPFSAASAASGSRGRSPFSASSPDSVFQDPTSPNSTWSGSTVQDVLDIATSCYSQNGIIADTHLGRNLCMAIPADIQELEKEMQNGNPWRWEETSAKTYHGENSRKFTIRSGPRAGTEVVFDKTTGQLVVNQNMGTRNKAADWKSNWMDHWAEDMLEHGLWPSWTMFPDQRDYHYVGIVYKTDEKGRIRIVDGRTGRPMTKEQVQTVPQTLGPGLQNLNRELLQREMLSPNGTSIQNGSGTFNLNAALNLPETEPGQLVQTPSGTVTPAPAWQTQTIDNSAMKAQMSALLENAYQYASGLAAEGGVGAEYQSAVAPVMSQGRAAISAIPDQQTVTVPAGSAQGGGYSSETMDAVGKAFAEQGPCSAGLLLQSLQNQNGQ